MKNFRFTLASILLAATLITSGAQAQVDRNINDYVLFAYDQLIFKGGNGTTTGFINGGNIGVNYPSGSIDLAYATSGSAIMSVGSQAVADTVRADNAGAVFWDLYANHLTPSYAATVLNSGPTAWSPTPIIATGLLPVLPFTAAHTNLTLAASDLTIANGANVTIGTGTYKNVRVNDNATVTLGAGTFNMYDLSIGKNVTFVVSDLTILQIDETFNPNDGLQFGVGTASGAHIYVGAFGLNVTTTRSGSFSQGAEIHAQYFSPTGWLDIGGGGNLYGRYWADVITGDPNNNVTFVPEPTTCLLVGFSLAALFAFGAQKRRA